MAGDGSLFTARTPSRRRGPSSTRCSPTTRRPAVRAGQLGPGGRRRADRRRRRLARPGPKRRRARCPRERRAASNAAMTQRRSSSCSTSTTRCSTTTAIIADLREHLDARVRRASADRYWAIFEELRSELGYADYLGALQRYRADIRRRPAAHRCCHRRASSSTIRSPNRLYPRALDVIARSAGCGPTVILSDGDVVFQPRKVERSGLWRRGRRPRPDLHPQGAGARRRRAPLSGATAT